MLDVLKFLKQSGCKTLTAFFVLIFLNACATNKYLSSPGHAAFHRKDYAQASSEFAKAAEKPSTNQLLFKLDFGSSLFAQKRYSEAVQVFLEAEKMAEIKDYTSIGEEVGALATSDNVRGYKGEDFEKVLINVYLAMGYAAMGESEDARVEARKINLILYRMINEGKKNYQESPFARYMSGMLWEDEGELSSAYIDYKKTYEMDSSFPEIGRDLLAMSRRLGFNDDLDRWRSKFSNETPRSIQKDQGELVVLFEAGYSPVKQPRGNDSSLPRFVNRYSDVWSAKVKADGRVVGTTEKVLDIERLSIAYLEDRIGRMAAAKVGGLAFKAAAAYGLGKATKSEDLGWLAFLALAAADQADLRSWRTLPRDIQLLRVPLAAGTHDIELEVLGSTAKTLYLLPAGPQLIKKGHKTFVVLR